MDKHIRARNAELRRLAEERMASANPESPPVLPEIDANRLNHELQVHQIELEMQNEELQRARAQVETAFQRYSDLYEFAPVGYLLLDHLGIILQANLSSAQMLDIHRSELIGRRLAMLVAQPDRTVLNAFIARAFANHTKQVCEVAMLPGSGADLAVRLEGMLSADSQECRVALIDLTERRQMEERMRQTITELHQQGIDKQLAEERLMLALRAGKVAIWEIELPTKRVTTLAGDRFGSLSQGPVTITRDEFVSGIHLDDRAQVDASLYKAVFEGVEQFATFRSIEPDGSTRWIALRCRRVLDDQGVAVKLVGSSSDVTEQKRLEQRLRILFHAAPDPIVLFDNTWTFHDVNHAYEVLTGYARAELIGHAPFDLGIIAVESIDHLRSQREDLMQHRPVSAFELILCSKEGKRIDVEVNLHTVEIDQQKLYLSAMHDISLRKQAEAVVLESNRKQTELNELKSRFVSIASHEFRNPLMTIMFTADILRSFRKTMDDAKIEFQLQQIISETEHMQSLIDDVLQLARTQSTGYVLKPAMLDLAAVCREIVNMLQGNPNLTHTLVFSSSQQSVNALLDAKLMKEAITNLITNAVKYSAAGTTVHIDLAVDEAQIVFRVSDQGIGIPSADVPHLFEPFHRAGNVDQIDGTGLGLSITKNAVELHGGTITVESEVGTGTTFTIRMPA